MRILRNASRQSRTHTIFASSTSCFAAYLPGEPASTTSSNSDNADWVDLGSLPSGTYEVISGPCAHIRCCAEAEYVYGVLSLRPVSLDSYLGLQARRRTSFGFDRSAPKQIDPCMQKRPGIPLLKWWQCVDIVLCMVWYVECRINLTSIAR